jgi:hypothetical protein
MVSAKRYRVYIFASLLPQSKRREGSNKFEILMMKSFCTTTDGPAILLENEF